MKLAIFSDLHLEFGSEKILEELVYQDVNIFAGDIGTGLFPVVTLLNIARDNPEKQFVQIFGNHEYYGETPLLMEHARDFINTASPVPNHHLLDNSSVEISGVRFYGGTCWTDLNKGNPIDIYRAQSSMNDFRTIRRMSPEWWLEQHQKFITGLEETLESTSDPVVVVSHHAPSAKSIEGRYKSSSINSAYHTPLDHYGDNPRVKLWVHGHTHHSFDYPMGETRVVCNPYGYHDYETNEGFKPDIVVEI